MRWRRTLALEAVAQAAVIAAACDIFRPGVGWLARASVLVWAMLPVVSADGVDGAALRRGARWPRRVAAASAVVPGVAASIAVFGAFPEVFRASIGEILLVLALWLLGYGLRDRGVAAFHEIVSYVVLVASLLRGASHEVALGAVAVVSLLIASALRRRGAEESRDLDVRFGFRAGALATVAFLALFLGGAAALPAPTRSSPDPATAQRVERPPRPPEARPFAGGSAQGSARDVAGSGGAGASLATWGEGELRLAPSGGGSGGDDHVVMTIEATAARGAWDDARAERTLFRARTLTRFDEATQSWRPPGGVAWSAPAIVGGVVVRGESASTQPPIEASVIVGDAALTCVPVPYGAIRLEFPPSVELAPAPDDDVVVAGELSAFATFRVMIDPAPREPVPGGETAEAGFREELELPANPALREHLRVLARAHLHGAPTLREKIAAVRAYCFATYRYERALLPPDAPENLPDFMLRKRRGDCRHLASACAMILRAGGIPARLCSGYAGADAFASRQVVWASSAHAWVEVRSGGRWVPVDPTEWVASRAERARAAAELRPRTEPRVMPLWLRVAVTVVVTWAAVVGIRRLLARLRRRRNPVIAASAVAEVRPGFVPGTPAERLLVAYADLDEDLSVTGCARRRHETPREHGRRVATEVRTATAFEALVPLLDDGLFGKVDLSEADVAPGHAAIGDLRERLG